MAAVLVCSHTEVCESLSALSALLLSWSEGRCIARCFWPQADGRARQVAAEKQSESWDTAPGWLPADARRAPERPLWLLDASFIHPRVSETCLGALRMFHTSGKSLSSLPATCQCHACRLGPRQVCFIHRLNQLRSLFGSLYALNFFGLREYFLFYAAW